MKGLFDHPVSRDSTPNTPAEMLRRLAVVLLPVSVVLAAGFTVQAVARRNANAAWTAVACIAVCAALLATRRRGGAVGSDAAVTSRPVPPSPIANPASGATIRPRVLLLNAGLGGSNGNSARVLARLADHLRDTAEIETTTLGANGAADFARITPSLARAHAVVIATGVHWDAWSSSLQSFLEAATPAEAGPLWLGKPAAVLVTEHSVGGKGVLSRLQGVLVTLGCEIPPLSGLVLSRAGQLARAGAPSDPAADDLWQPDDLAVVAHNLLAAAQRPAVAWRAWPVDRAHYVDRWLE